MGVDYVIASELIKAEPAWHAGGPIYLKTHFPPRERHPELLSPYIELM